MKDKSTHSGAARGHVAAAGPSESPSWNILKKCLLVDGIAVVLMVLLAFIFTDAAGMLSVVFGSLLVMAFFGLSLLLGHIFNRRMPRAAINIFFMTYFVKVVGFAAVLFALGTPEWLNKPWFLAGAVVCVLLWQATEVVIFSRQRFLLFEDTAESNTAESNTAESNTAESGPFGMEPGDAGKPRDTSL